MRCSTRRSPTISGSASRQQGGVVDWTVTEQVVNEARGVAVPVSRRGISYEGYLAAARRVENTLPEGANWDGSDSEDEPAGKASGVGASRTKH